MDTSSHARYVVGGDLLMGLQEDHDMGLHLHEGEGGQDTALDLPELCRRDSSSSVATSLASSSHDSYTFVDPCAIDSYGGDDKQEFLLSSEANHSHTPYPTSLSSFLPPTMARSPSFDGLPCPLPVSTPKRTSLPTYAFTPPHSAPQLLPCRWPNCSWSTYDASELVLHVEGHSQQFSHLCDLCNEGFPDADSFRRHYREHASGAGSLGPVRTARKRPGLSRLNTFDGVSVSDKGKRGGFGGGKGWSPSANETLQHYLFDAGVGRTGVPQIKAEAEPLSLGAPSPLLASPLALHHTLLVSHSEPTTPNEAANHPEVNIDSQNYFTILSDFSFGASGSDATSLRPSVLQPSPVIHDNSGRSSRETSISDRSSSQVFPSYVASAHLAEAWQQMTPSSTPRGNSDEPAWPNSVSGSLHPSVLSSSMPTPDASPVSSSMTPSSSLGSNASAAVSASAKAASNSRRRAMAPPPLVVSSEDKTHRCTYDGCMRKFKRLEHLNRHIRSHTGEKLYQCDEPGCDKWLSRSDNLRAHKLTHGKGGRNDRACAQNLARDAATTSSSL